MDNVNLIKNTLEYYDYNKNKYSNIKEKYFNLKDNNITFTKKRLIDIFQVDSEYNYSLEFFGLYDLQTTIWTWAWALNSQSLKENDILKQLVNYALKLEAHSNNNDHYYIKAQLLNSKILFKNSLDLELHLALILYLLKENIITIYEQKCYYDEEKTKIYFKFFFIKKVKK
jgi:hypothetical protein